MTSAPLLDPLGAFVPGSGIHRKSQSQGPLSGLTFAAKDIYDLEGAVTGCGNPDWAATHPPAKADAWAVTELLRAGADLVGKTITDELAYSLNGQNAHYGTPTNVNAPGRIPGGSSSGSAAAVAGGLVDCALGSDTGGSVRIPASYCGLYGLRPTHGRLSLQGVMPLAPSFDTVGWFARDARTFREVGRALFDSLPQGKTELRHLLLAEDVFGLLDAAVAAELHPLVQALEGRFGQARRVSALPSADWQDLMLTFRLLQAHEIQQQHKDWILETRPTFGPEVAERFSWALSIRADRPAQLPSCVEHALRATLEFVAHLGLSSCNLVAAMDILPGGVL